MILQDYVAVLINSTESTGEIVATVDRSNKRFLVHISTSSPARFHKIIKALNNNDRVSILPNRGDKLKIYKQKK